MSSWPPNMTVRPLLHPGTTRAHDRKPSAFSAGWATTLTTLGRELQHLGAARIVLELDITESDLRIDGTPRASSRPATPAVALSFESDYGPLRYATDVFTGWQDNVRAIALGLESLRKVDRYGITKRGEQYTGWKALPPPSTYAQLMQEAYELAGYHDPIELASWSQFSPEQVCKAALRKVHPDNPETGDRAKFERVQKIRRLLEQRATK